MEREEGEESINTNTTNNNNNNNTTTASNNNKTEKSNSPTPNTTANAFECNTCLETPEEPVVTNCGHLFCWPCIFRWLEVHKDQNSGESLAACPVCKSAVSKTTVIPIYGRGKEKTDPRDKPIPEEKNEPRPQGRRTETPRSNYPRNNDPFQYSNWGYPIGSAYQAGGFQFSAGFGLFPMFGMHFQIPNNGVTPEQPQNVQQVQQLSLFLMMLAILVIMCLFW